MRLKYRKLFLITVLSIILSGLIIYVVESMNINSTTIVYAELKPLSVVKFEKHPDVEEFTNKIMDDIKEKEELEKQKEKEILQSKYLGTFLLTGYDDCYECQEEYVGTTALGVAPQPYHTIAVDTSIIPLGTHVLINGIEYVAEDVGGGVNGYHIDIFVGSHEETFSSYCNGYAEVYLV